MLFILIGIVIFCYALYLILMTVIDHSGVIEELQEIKTLLKKISDEIGINSEEELVKEDILSIGKCPACGAHLIEKSEVCQDCGLVLNHKEEEK